MGQAAGRRAAEEDMAAWPGNWFLPLSIALIHI
jgi:hypothetical protein